MKGTNGRGTKRFLNIFAYSLVISLYAAALFAAQEGSQLQRQKYELRAPLDVQIPWGLDILALRIPVDNPMTREKVDLGRRLFFDRLLSRDGTVSCADCHDPKLAFTDGKRVATGIKGQKGRRNSPTLVNRAFSTSQFWDGRAGSLEEQAKGPMVDSLEMGNRSHDDVVTRLKNVEAYRVLFVGVFDTEDFTIDHVAKAIAAFERTLLSGNSPFDQFQRGEESAISPAARRGFELFSGKARCITCHKGFNLTDEQFHTLGSAYEKADSDPGLYQITRQERDRHRFKTPTLREIANTGPYMHDGRFKNLEEVVEFYDRGGLKESYGCAPNASATTPPIIGLGFPLPERLSRVLRQVGITNPVSNAPGEIKPLNLSKKEKKDLVEYLRSLAGEGWQHLGVPAR